MTILSKGRLRGGGDTRLLVLMLAMMCAIASRAVAQCEPQWLPGDGVPGVSDTVMALQAWDDGTGEALYVGGWSGVAGNTEANGIFRWDGQSIEALGSGVDGGIVWAMTEFQGRLVAAGYFATAGGKPAHNIATWDGSTWQAVGDGTACLGGVCGWAAVMALTEYEGDLIAGGAFDTAGGAPAACVARWDGTAWHAMGAGFNAYVSDVIVLDGALIATGGFTNSGGQTVNRIARWDGAAWQPLGTGLDAIGHCLAVFDGDLIVGGDFYHAGGQVARNIARWDGASWHPIGNQITSRVNGLTVYEGKLIAVGSLHLWPSANPLWHVAEWDGRGWNAVGGGTNWATYGTATTYRGELIVGDTFTLAGQTPVANVARWDGRTWRPVGESAGTNASVLTMNAHDGALIAGGDFTMIGGAAAAAIATFDGARWHPLGAGVARQSGFPAWVACTGDFNGDLVIGGRFDFADGQPAESVARWDGTAWHAMGQGMNGYVYGFEEFRGSLIAVGYFYDLDHVARWDGEQWHTVGGGTDEYVQAAVVYRGQLVIGGRFNTVGGLPIDYLARWDGSVWSGFGAGFGEIVSMIVYNGELIVSGCCGTVRWDEMLQTWQMMDMPFEVAVNEFKIINGTLYAASRFGFASPEHELILRWDGQSWHPVGGQIDYIVETLAEYNGDLFIGGIFSTVNGVVSPFLAHAEGVFSPADLTCDGVVNIDDLLALLGAWGPCPAPPASCPADIAPRSTPDGVVDIADIELLILNWN